MALEIFKPPDFSAQVLFQWREAAALRADSREKVAVAVKDAQRHLQTGEGGDSLEEFFQPWHLFGSPALSPTCQQ